MQYSRSFSQPIANLSQQFNNILAALAGAERIFDVIDREPEEDNGYVKLVNAKYDENGNLTECKEHTGLWAWKHPHSGDNTVTYQKLEGDVVFENVYFSYDGKRRFSTTFRSMQSRVRKLRLSAQRAQAKPR